MTNLLKLIRQGMFENEHFKKVKEKENKIHLQIIERHNNGEEISVYWNVEIRNDLRDVIEEFCNIYEPSDELMIKEKGYNTIIGNGSFFGYREGDKSFEEQLKFEKETNNYCLFNCYLHWILSTPEGLKKMEEMIQSNHK